jgi:hypothetical protein
MAKYAYVVEVKLPENRVVRYGIVIPANSWQLIGYKRDLANEHKVDLDDVVVFTSEGEAIL